jgi:predicted RNA-binding Zn ribbon-like protein
MATDTTEATPAGSDAAAAAEPSIPPGWVHRTADDPVADVDLAVLLLNSLDLMEDPPDRLTSVSWYADVLIAAGHPGLAAGLTEADLEPLRELRALLRLVFTADSVDEAADILNPLLLQHHAVPVLVTVEPGTPTLRVAPAATGFAALAARLPAAAATLIAESELRRLGTCAGDPCQCAFVDRSRSGNRRFCCDWCNDRAAAAAYRRRKKSAH